MILVKFALFAFAAWWIFKSVARFLFGNLVKQAQQQQQQFNQQRQSGHSQQAKPKDGNVSVQFSPKKDKKSADNFKGGDYVDYEEVD
jgi:hypothetical protein